MGDTVDVAGARLKRGAHDVLDAVSDAASGLGDQVNSQLTAARRDLAARLDPDPGPRRGLRVLALGLLVTTVAAVVWAVLERTVRTPAAPPRGGPEHTPPVAGLTGDPQARS